jgi:6-phosphogluconolactonase
MALRMDVRPDADAVAQRAAEIVAERAAAAIADHGRFTFAVSGDHTPWGMFARPAGREMAWEQATIFPVDERVAPDSDPCRNPTHLRASSPPGASADVRPMPVTADDLDRAPTNTLGRCPTRSIWSTPGSGPAATRPRSSPAIRSST